MLIIFEGISCAGKTTLSQEVSKSLAVPLFSECLGLVHELNENYDFFDLINFGINKTILELVKKFNLDLVLDRGFVSDLVSASFFRHKNMQFQRSTYDKILSGLNYKIFFLSIDKETLILRKQNRKYNFDIGEDYINKWLKLQNYTQKLIKYYNYNVEFLNSNKPLNELVTQIKESIKK